jgi:hypothetical protein
LQVVRCRLLVESEDFRDGLDDGEGCGLRGVGRWLMGGERGGVESGVGNTGDRGEVFVEDEGEGLATRLRDGYCNRFGCGLGGFWSDDFRDGSDGAEDIVNDNVID